MDAGSAALSGSIPPSADGGYKSETRLRLVGCSPHPLLTPNIYICRLREMKLRLSPQTLQVLDAFLQAPKDWSSLFGRNTVGDSAAWLIPSDIIGRLVVRLSTRSSGPRRRPLDKRLLCRSRRVSALLSPRKRFSSAMIFPCTVTVKN